MSGGGVAVSGDVVGSFGEVLGVLDGEFGATSGVVDGCVGVVVAPGVAVSALGAAVLLVSAVGGVVVLLGVWVLAPGVCEFAPGDAFSVPSMPGFCAVLCVPVVLWLLMVLAEPVLPVPAPAPAPADCANAQQPHSSSVPVKRIDLRFIGFLPTVFRNLEMAAQLSDGKPGSRDVPPEA